MANEQCVLEGCSKAADRVNRTICEMHYYRMRRYGSYDATKIIRGDEVARFWSRVKKSSPNECWEWRGAINNGYGSFHAGGRTVGAHRYSLEIANGSKLPEGMETCHTCDNRKCVNPNHLYWGTRQQNVDDAWDRSRMPHGESHREARLSERDVVALRYEYAAGAEVQDLCLTYGLAESTIRCIVLGFKWKRAGGPITRRRAINEKKVA